MAREVTKDVIKRMKLVNKCLPFVSCSDGMRYLKVINVFVSVPCMVVHAFSLCT